MSSTDRSSYNAFRRGIVVVTRQEIKLINKLRLPTAETLGFIFYNSDLYINS